MNKLRILILSMMALVPGFLSAQEETSQSFLEQFQFEIILGIMVLVCIVALLALIVAWWGLRVVVRARLEEQGLATEDTLIKAQPGEEHLGFWAKFWNRFNAAVPVAQEANVETDHSYDGIRELDNRLPPWWLYGFYFTIAFGVVYILRYEVFDTAPNQEQEFQTAMIEAEEQVQTYLASLDNLIDESNVELLTEQADVDAGSALYAANCAVCHAADGGGGVGPNFTDKYWLHGGDVKSIFSTIKYGVPSKGMISWESQLSPKEMQQLASFIYTLEGNEAAKPKDPQGELFEREEGGSEEEVASDSTSMAAL